MAHSDEEEEEEARESTSSSLLAIRGKATAIVGDRSGWGSRRRKRMEEGGLMVL